MTADWLLAAAIGAPFTLLPGVLMIRSARRKERWADSLHAVHRAGEVGVVNGRVVSEATATAPISGRASSLVLCNIQVDDVGQINMAEETWTAGNNPLHIDVLGTLVAVEWTKETLQGFGVPQWGVVTKREGYRLEELPEALRHFDLDYPSSCRFRVRELSLAPGDRVAILGTLQESGEGHSPVESAPLRVVGTKTQPLQFSTHGLKDIDEGTFTAQEIFGGVLISFWIGFIILIGVLTRSP